MFTSFRSLLTLLIVGFVSLYSPLEALICDSSCEQTVNEHDFPVVNDWLITKRWPTLKEKFPNFRISGDIRAEWAHRTESVILPIENPDTKQVHEIVVPVRGHGFALRGKPIPIDTFEGEINLRLEYKNKRVWGLALLNYDNSYGIGNDAPCLDPHKGEQLFGSGFCDDVCLKRAYMGYRAYELGDLHVDVEIGRKPLYTIFDSKVQFKSRFDGIVLHFSDTCAKYDDKRKTDYYLKLIASVIDYTVNHFGFGGETGIYNIADSGVDLKYSLMDWKKKGTSRCGIQDPSNWSFVDSQVTFAFNFHKTKLNKPIRFYGAGIINHAARKDVPVFTLELADNGNAFQLVDNTIILRHKENLGGYVGFTVGEMKKAGDYSFDINYQYVEAQCVPEIDVRGIGRGNLYKNTFLNSFRGNGNYKGVNVGYIYGLTDALTLELAYDVSRPVNRNLGGVFRYSRFAIDMIHTF